MVLTNRLNEAASAAGKGADRWGVLYTGGKYVGKVVWRLFADFKVSGLENVPPRGPLLIIANHLSYFEPPMFAVIMPRKVHFMAKSGLFQNPVYGWALRSVNAFPVDREVPDAKSLRRALDLLAEGAAVAVFPEGTRAQAPGLQRGLPGVTYLALKSQAPILPVGITGTEGLRGIHRVFAPFRRIRVNIGEPFTLPLIEGRLSRGTLESVTEMMMGRLAEQLPPEYRGVYGASATRPEAAEG